MTYIAQGTRISRGSRVFRQLCTMLVETLNMDHVLEWVMNNVPTVIMSLMINLPKQGKRTTGFARSANGPWQSAHTASTSLS